MADDLSARGSGLRARQTKVSPHAPENPREKVGFIKPHPDASAVNLRVDIDFLVQGLEGMGSLSVGKDEQQPKQFPEDESGRGDDRSQIRRGEDRP